MFEKLTERQIEVLELMTKGLSNYEIMDVLKLSLATVKTHINNIYMRLGLTDFDKTAKNHGVIRLRAVLWYLKQKGIL